MEDRLFMTEKITITPNEVRGLGNIVSEKNYKNFLPVDCRLHEPQQATVNGVTRDVFLVDMSPAGTLVDTYVSVDGPSIVDLDDEEIVFTVALYQDNGVRVTNVPLTCLTPDGEVVNATSNQYGYATFTLPNVYSEGRYTFTFASQTIIIQDNQRFDNAYRNHSLLVVSDDGEYYFDLISVENPIQTGSVSHLISRFCVDGIGVPSSTVYFFEEFTKSVLKGSASLESFVSGETTTLSAELKDTDGSAVQEAPVYFFMESDSSVYDILLTVSKSQVMMGETITFTVTALDENGYGVPGAEFKLKKGQEVIGTVTTNGDGKVTYDYAGEGSGDFIFYASYVSGISSISEAKYIIDAYTYGTKIDHFLTNEPSIPRITSDGNKITLYSYDTDGADGYASTPVLFDRVFDPGDKWEFQTQIDTLTDISIVAVVGYPATAQSGATIITAGHDPRVTSEAGADDPDNTAFVKGTDVEFITHTFAADDLLTISNNGNTISFSTNDTRIGSVNSPNYPYYIGFMVTSEAPQFFEDITIKKYN